MNLILRYFIPFLAITPMEFSQQCNDHEVYYELYQDSIGNQTELVKRTSDDKVIQRYVYTSKPDSTWFIPIKNRVDSLEDVLVNSKDKEEKKRANFEINWLKNRYY